jgi:hypothetical protein
MKRSAKFPEQKQNIVMEEEKENSFVAHFPD